MAVGGLDAAILIAQAGIVAEGLHAAVPAQIVVAPRELSCSRGLRRRARGGRPRISALRWPYWTSLKKQSRGGQAESVTESSGNVSSTCSLSLPPERIGRLPRKLAIRPRRTRFTQPRMLGLEDLDGASGDGVGTPHWLKSPISLQIEKMARFSRPDPNRAPDRSDRRGNRSTPSPLARGVENGDRLR
jgi:hypothetical protein